ncbi:ribonuclease H-like protein [Suillus paluster]|uniref:ribonuclease H-like protein n=1 Tax=Suillus paluster TaxID=48578 RepID=UPI001B88431C|nr:ribonuclease H-like protein [Suillus paluster]KAG1728984.1 ribonuclease H-like protein [Suillus paluster]
MPAHRLQTPTRGRPTNDRKLTIYTDGSCTNNGKENAKCGGGIWVGEDHPLNRAIRIPGPDQSNQAGKLAAILVALQSVDPLTPLTIITDSQYVINGLTTHLKEWEDQGWIGITNSKLFQAMAYHLRRRSASTTFQWIKGHNGNHSNEGADQLANARTQKNDPDTINMSVPLEFDLQGAKLMSMTQQLAYRGILAKTHLDYKKTTLSLLDITRYAIETVSKTIESDKTIWTSCRNKDISKKVQMFLYKTLQNAYKVGDFWLQIPTFEQRARCRICDEDSESMDHILTQCNNPTRTTIWELAKNVWPDKYEQWPNITIGLILGCGALTFPHDPTDIDPKNKAHAAAKKGAARLLRILISESAYLIWTLRCERVIREATTTENNIIKRWIHAIDKRLQIDRVIATKHKRNQKAIAQVQNTWADVITIDTLLHKDWVTTLEVLVGIKLPRPPQTEVTR